MSAGEGCVVVFSGGQDSTTCLHWALSRFARVEAVFFDYGQRHIAERRSAEAIAARLGVPLRIFPLEFFRLLGGNALTDAQVPVEPGDPASGNLPATFVPGRNLIFLGCAASYAYTLGLRDLVTGVCEADYSGYPDCRQETLDALARALSLGLGLGADGLRVHAPLMRLDKAASVRLAAGLGALGSLALSHTCYQGSYPPCGACQACRLRAKGFAAAGVPDPLLERAAGRAS